MQQYFNNKSLTENDHIIYEQTVGSAVVHKRSADHMPAMWRQGVRGPWRHSTPPPQVYLEVFGLSSAT